MPEVNMWCAHDRPAAQGVGNIEEVRIGAAGVADSQGLAHLRAGSVAPGEVVRLADLLGSVRPPQSCPHARALFKVEELGPTLDRQAFLLKAPDKQSLVLVLREDQHVRIETEAPADLAEGGARYSPAA